jgi:hypothetical protein
MRKRLTIGLLTSGLMIGLLPGIASAIPSTEPVGGCPRGGGWVLTPTFFVSASDNGNTGDQNGDLWACRKPNPGTGFFTWKDNTNPLPPV